MKNISLLAPWIRRFLLEHLVADRTQYPEKLSGYIGIVSPIRGQKAWKTHRHAHC